MIEDGTGIRHHAKAFGDVGTVIPPIILYLKAEVTGCNSVEGSMTPKTPYRRCDRL